MNGLQTGDRSFETVLADDVRWAWALRHEPETVRYWLEIADGLYRLMGDIDTHRVWKMCRKLSVLGYWSELIRLCVEVPLITMEVAQ